MTVIGKGNKERTVYLNNASLKAIHNYLPTRLEKNDKVAEIDKDALFISRNNRRINKRSVELIIKKYISNAGLDFKTTK